MHRKQIWPRPLTAQTTWNALSENPEKAMTILF